MSRTELLALKRMCSKSETYDRALTLLNAAKLKTGAGTGYDLGQGASGLPAICVYIASEQLNNNDVSKKVAQTASCLAPKIFDSSLSVVRSALFAQRKKDLDATTGPRSGGNLSYEAFVKRFGWKHADFMVECMEDVEYTLTASRELKGKLAPPNTAVTVVVACWVCAVLSLKKVRPNALQEEFGVSSKDFGTIEETINGICDVVKKDILQKVKAMKVQKAAATPSEKASQQSPSPRKRSTGVSPRSTSKTRPRLSSRSPTKSALKVAASIELSPSKTPSHKRKVAFIAETDDDDETDGPDLETPSRKRRKVSGSASLPSLFVASAKPLPALDLTPARPVASSSKVTIDDQAFADVPCETDDRETAMLIDVPDPNAATPAPSTPRPTRRSTAQALPPTTPSHHYGTASRSTKKNRLQSHAGEVDQELVMPRRTRPVLLGYKQWYARDPRLERELKLADAAKKNLVDKFGHPFEHLRIAATKAGVV